MPLDLTFQDETGKTVQLGDYLGDKPLLISINDFTCQDLCPLELQNLVDAMDQVTFRLGADYNVAGDQPQPGEHAAETQPSCGTRSCTATSGLMRRTVRTAGTS